MIIGALPVAACLLLFALPLSADAAPAVQALRSAQVLSVDESGGPIRFPSGITYDREGDEIYVTSPQKNKLVVLTPDYFPYISVGSGRGLNSINKSYVKNGLLYVCLGSSSVEERPHIAILDMAFMPVKEIFFTDFEDFVPLDLVVGVNGNLYVVGMNGTGVMVLDPEGNFLRWIEPTDEVLEVSEKAPILAIDIGLDGHLYLLSESMGRVYVYDQNERFLYRFGQKGGEPGKLSRPRGIAVDDFRHQVYLVDYQRHTMSVYAQSGEYLFEVGGLGGSRGWFYYPSDVAVDGHGRVIVADTFNHRLQVFEFISDKGFGGADRLEQPSEVPDQTIVKQTFVEQEVVEAAQAKKLLRVRRLKDELQLDEPGDYLVLTGMTKKRQDAETLAQQLVRKGFPAKVRDVERSKSGRWHQVLVGPYEDPMEAYRVAEKLRTEEQLPAMLKTRGKEIDLEIPLATPEPPIENSERQPESLSEVILPLQDTFSDFDLSETEEHFDPVVIPPSAEHAALEKNMPVAECAVDQGAGSQAVELPVESSKRESEFCLKCHEHPVANVCMTCHLSERKDRV